MKGFQEGQSSRCWCLKVVDLGTDPQLMGGALGAAEYARQKGLAKTKGEVRMKERIWKIAKRR